MWTLICENLTQDCILHRAEIEKLRDPKLINNKKINYYLFYYDFAKRKREQFKKRISKLSYCIFINFTVSRLILFFLILL